MLLMRLQVLRNKKVSVHNVEVKRGSSTVQGCEFRSDKSFPMENGSLSIDLGIHGAISTSHQSFE